MPEEQLGYTRTDEIVSKHPMAGDGLVHGHIHKYNNLTYIHGHIHHTAVGENNDSSSSLSNNGPVLQQVEGIPIASAKRRMSNMTLLDCKHFEFVDYHGLNDVNSAYNGMMSWGDTNYNMNSKFGHALYPGGNSNYVIDDELLVTKKRKVCKKNEDRDCNCNPKVLEVCCDIKHDPKSVDPEPQTDIREYNDLNMNIYTNSQGFFSNTGYFKQVIPTVLNQVASTSTATTATSTSISTTATACTTATTSSISANKSSIANGKVSDSKMVNQLPIKCDLTCEQNCKMDPDLHCSLNEKGSSTENTYAQEVAEDFENFCRECLTSTEQVPNHQHQHQHTRIQQNNEVQILPGKENCHDHVVNSEMDMKVLDDLWNITSLYELPFTKHKNHHDIESHAMSKSKNISEDYHSYHKEHHHHLIQFHPHSSIENTNPDLGYLHVEHNQNYPVVGSDYSYERKRRTPEIKKEQDSPSVLHHHVKSDKGNCKANIANETELNTINFNWIFKQEEDIANKDIDCKWNKCPEKYKSLIDLQKHVLRDHVSKQTVDSTDTICNWQDCLFEGEDICSLINHINTKHGINFDIKYVNLNANVANEEDGSKKAASDIKIENESAISDGLPCKWDGCNEVFLSCKELNAHIEEKHLESGQSEYRCLWKDCGHKFTQRQKILRHIRVHSGFKPFKCESCNKTFASEENLIQHKRTHSGEKPFVCQICGSKFSSPSYLKVHIRIHTGEKPLSCKVCGKKFSSSSNLNKHYKTHYKKYKCQGCLSSFTDKDKFETHLKKCNRQDTIVKDENKVVRW
ncbi:hypothetical protein Kpol_1035p22 [Vanderwaltozyma polyspora DSM 70294]|uniref:C2H2-type domain-containing protein n=1 Tax=Vanderwaltozyma polyspora (strain ATCC 22028 / DSM 70294 / BCRC 21397 / CBS 2163 / NBRC 10782 / NRRL Y-8283 / UCD 57-17) TaxID=436907 RepID=A7TKI7_VANPO|nr:uncharacterized protein Kpol_1035p22 [Vanderwaltozyma polyspora DSM 70294]EDO17209.1 hypothetical protein Kpol_1035p22 [Vanderwaltozyma polyspora DSM 70294]